MGECLRFGIKGVPQTASAWVKCSKARVPFTSWCCNIVIGNGSRVIIMGVTYMFNIFIKISRAMSLIYFMKHIKLPNTYNIIYRQPINVIANLMMTMFHLNTTVVTIFLDCKTVGFFLKISKEIGNAWHKSLTRAKHGASRPFVWLLARTWIHKNTHCFAVYNFSKCLFMAT